MVIVRLQKIVKIKIYIEFRLYKAQMMQNQKVNIYVQSTHTFTRVFPVTKKSIVTHISLKIKKSDNLHHQIMKFHFAPLFTNFESS